jgi:putative FmdB family regulatory protein
MPLYEYRCERCDTVFEVIQRFSDEPLKTHEGCGGAVERLLSAPALQFKGTGWYVTDYARAGSNGSAKDAGDSAKTDAKPETKSEGKAETKSETKSEGKKSATKPATPSAASSSEKK